MVEKLGNVSSPAAALFFLFGLTGNSRIGLMARRHGRLQIQISWCRFEQKNSSSSLLALWEQHVCNRSRAIKTHGFIAG